MTRLTALLEELRDNSLATSGDLLARLVDVIRPRRRETLEVAGPRLRTLAQVIESRPDLAAALSSHVAAQLTSRMHRILYADSGMLTDQSFRAGLARRVLGRLLPPATDNDYLRSLIAEVFDHPDDHRWLVAVPRADWDALLDALDVTGEIFAPARRKCWHELLEALRLASTRLAAAGTDPALLQYLPALARHESPFLAQVDEVRAVISQQGGEEPVKDDGHLEVLLAQCDEYVERVRRRSHEAGVGVNLSLSEVIRLVNKFSSNVMARHLLLTLAVEKAGRPGTTAAGGRVIGEFFAGRGVDVPGLVLENGSGLSRVERISAEGLANVLLDAWRSPYAAEIQASLPLSAVDGTLRRRFRSPDMEGRLRMKTGSLQDVSALAGYVNAASGRSYVTVIMLNHPGADSGAGESVQAALVNWVFAR